MAVRAFRLLRQSVLDAAARALGETMSGWSAAWGIDGASLTLACRRGETAAGLPTNWERCTRAGEARMWMHASPGLRDAVQRTLFPADGSYVSKASGPGELAHGGSVAALDAMRLSLCETLLPGAVEEVGGPAPTDLAVRGSGTLLLTIELGRESMRCALDQGAVLQLERLLGGASAALPALPRLNFPAVLGSVPVTLRVRIGSGVAQLSSLMAAGVGDVVRLDASVDTPIELLGPSGHPLLRAHLGRCGPVMAIEIAGTI